MTDQDWKRWAEPECNVAVSWRLSSGERQVSTGGPRGLWWTSNYAWSGPWSDLLARISQHGDGRPPRFVDLDTLTEVEPTLREPEWANDLAVIARPVNFPYRSVFWRTPDGGWTTYLDHLPDTGGWRATHLCDVRRLSPECLTELDAARKAVAS